MERSRKGYKQTEVGVIPEDWADITMSQIGETYTGLSGKKAADFGCGEAKYIPFLNILINSKIDKSFLESVSVRNNEFQNRVKYGDLFFNTSSETPEEVGMCSVILDDIPNLYLNSFCFGFRLFQPDEINGLYLSYYFRSEQGRTLMTQLAQGATRYNLAKHNFLQAKIILPKNKEQKVIAEVLSDIDSLIEALDKKIAKKRAIKGGVMQQLLTGKKRLKGFTEPWVEKIARDIFDVNKGTQINRATLLNSHSEYPVMNGGIEPSGHIDRYNNDGRTIIISEGGNSCGYVNYMGQNFWAGGHCYVVSPKTEIDIKYLYTTLKYYEPVIMQLRTGSGLPNIQKKRLLDELEIFLATSTKEQTAIAQILTDMDSEIGQLERERQKYTSLKEGAMQQLLTGQIRLANAEQSQQQPKIRMIPMDAHIIGGHIVNTLHQSRGWGRTKLQKSMHLIGYHCQLDFGNEYVRNVAGPDDQKLMNHLDIKFKQFRHVNVERISKGKGNTHYNYTPTPMIAELEQVFEKYPVETRNEINSLLNKLKAMDLARAEIVSTLYAVWNNRIIKKQPIDDDLLLVDFYDWSDHKADFEQDLVLRALNYMRREGIIPRGWGKYIDKM
jgi:type I restriction enzyme S subunit